MKNSNDGLKKDELDISDPFGQSYDEFLTPFSGGNPQDEQLEKRKLALRGLHNLINNLG
ncbi:small heat shock protein C2 [Desmospora sp. 8437]|nr:small heat shock protein C2 [Desmospora sp. 8437]